MFKLKYNFHVRTFLPTEMYQVSGHAAHVSCAYNKLSIPTRFDDCEYRSRNSTLQRTELRLSKLLLSGLLAQYFEDIDPLSEGKLHQNAYKPCLTQIKHRRDVI